MDAVGRLVKDSASNVSGASSIAKALAVLEAVGISRRVSLGEIAEEVDLPKSTLLRLIATLIARGFLRRTGHGAYDVGLKAWQVGCNAFDPEALRNDVVPALRTLVERTGETAHYSVYEAGHTIYVEKMDGSHPIRAYTNVGGRSPAYATATGKAMLAFRGERDIAAIAAQAQPWTAATHVGADLVAHCAEIRRAGYAVNRGEWRGAVWGIGAPVFDRSETVVAAVGVSGPSDRIEPNLESFAEIVCGVARKLSRRLGTMSRAS